MTRLHIGVNRSGGLSAIMIATLALAGCSDGFGLNREKSETPPAVKTVSGETGTRDIEAPDIFDVSEAGLWDGRPSLGGIWVAHPDVTDPQRVIIRNTSNGQSVVGALFRRQRDIPGPRIQVSSDAAEAIALLPGAPVNLHVTALTRETVSDESASDAGETPDDAGTSEETATISDQTEAGKEAEAETGGFRWPWQKKKETGVEVASANALDSSNDILDTVPSAEQVIDETLPSD